MKKLETFDYFRSQYNQFWEAKNYYKYKTKKLEELERTQNNHKKQLDKIEQNLEYIKQIRTTQELKDKIDNIETKLQEIKEITLS